MTPSPTLLPHHFFPRSSLTQFALPTDCYLSDVLVYDIDESGSFRTSVDEAADAIVRMTLDQGSATICEQQDMLPADAASALAIPVFRGGHTVSVVVLFARKANQEIQDPVGVFEIWEPIGEYEEVGLRSGYYGKMERFQNVSSFVRFEKGSGLPGQVWSGRLAIVQDDLGNHPGFLRAAGASADLLQSAIGIPVASEQFCCTAVLISSQSTPIARAFEVWNRCDDHFELTSCAYMDVEDGFALELGSTCPLDEGILGHAMRIEQAALVEDVPALMLARSSDLAMPSPTAGLAIPHFQGDTVTSICLLMF